jgi:putative flippase GtrA
MNGRLDQLRWRARGRRHAVFAAARCAERGGGERLASIRVPRFCAYSVVGAMGFAVQIAALAALSALAALPDWVAVALAVECAILHNFIWHERWTWVDRTGGSCEGVMRRLAKFNLATGGFSILSNLGLTAFFATAFGLPLIAANVAAVVSLSVVTFVTSDRLVFAWGRE